MRKHFLLSIQRGSYLWVVFPWLFVSLTLSGCGASGAGTFSDQKIEYRGKTTAARLTAGNAPLFFAEIMGTDEGTTVLAKRTPQQGAGASSAVHTLLPRIKDGFKGVLHPDSPLSQKALPGKRLAKSVNETIPCESGSVTMKGEIGDDGTGTVQMTFESCLREGATFNGTGVLDVRQSDSATGEFSDSIMTFDRLDFKDATNDYSMGGSLHSQVFLTIGYEKVEADLVVIDHLIRKTWKLENWTEILTYDDILNPTSYSEDFSGRLYDFEEGYVDVSVYSYAANTYSLNYPLTYRDIDQDFPDGGGPVFLEGDSGSWAILTILSDPGKVRVEVDSDGDGFYESEKIYVWEGLIENVVANDSQGVFQLTGSLNIPRISHEATVLLNGKVLIT